MSTSGADDGRLAYTPPAKPLLIGSAEDVSNAFPPATYNEDDGVTSYVSG